MSAENLCRPLRGVKNTERENITRLLHGVGLPIIEDEVLRIIHPIARIGCFIINPTIEHGFDRERTLCQIAFMIACAAHDDKFVEHGFWILVGTRFWASALLLTFDSFNSITIRNFVLWRSLPASHRSNPAYALAKLSFPAILR
jgi:hypothetical protein